MRDASERENVFLFSIQSLTSVCPNDLGSCPIYRFLHGSQSLQMTKIPLRSLHSLEITNFGYNGNMPFLVFHGHDLLEGLVELLNVFTSCHVLSLRLVVNALGTSFIASFVC